MSSVFKNANWLLLERLILMPVSLGVSVLLARGLGPSDFGRLNFLLALVTLFTPLIQFGLNSLVTREICSAQRPASDILRHCIYIRTAVFAIVAICMCVLLAFDWLSIPDLNMFSILMISQLFVAVEVVIYWFESQVNMRPIVWCRLFSTLLFALCKMVALMLDASLWVLVIVFALEIAFTNILLLATYVLCKTAEEWHWTLDVSYARQLIKQASWLILSAVAAIVYLKIDQVMLGYLHSETEVGLYAVAARISEVWYFAPVAVVSSFFPAILRARKANREQYNQLLIKIMGGLFWSGLSVAVLISLTASFIIQILYGNGYQESAAILTIHVWAGVFIFMRALLSKWLIAENILSFSLVTQGTGCVVNVILNYYWIPAYGGVGAAWATLLSYAAASWLALFVHKDTRPMAYMMTCSPIQSVYIWFKHR